jgi:hypothetical protein
VRPTIHLHPVSRSGMCAAVLPRPNMPSCCVGQSIILTDWLTAAESLTS